MPILKDITLGRYIPGGSTLHHLDPRVKIVAATVLMGALLGSRSVAVLVGFTMAKALASGWDVPFVAVNHLEGHVYATWLEEGATPIDEPGLPLLCLIASGGHTDLVLMRGHGKYQLLGRTRDDAAGEAFDKAARVLGLGFPALACLPSLCH